MVSTPPVQDRLDATQRLVERLIGDPERIPDLLVVDVGALLSLASQKSWIRDELFHHLLNGCVPAAATSKPLPEPAPRLVQAKFFERVMVYVEASEERQVQFNVLSQERGIREAFCAAALASMDSNGLFEAFNHRVHRLLDAMQRSSSDSDAFAGLPRAAYWTHWIAACIPLKIRDVPGHRSMNMRPRIPLPRRVGSKAAPRREPNRQEWV